MAPEAVQVPLMSPRRTWLVAWLAGPLIGIANGTLRELGYKDRVGERTAHQLSTGSAIALFAAYFELLARVRPLTSTREALQVGLVWLALTVAFEFGFVRQSRILNRTSCGWCRLRSMRPSVHGPHHDRRPEGERAR